MRRRNFLLSPLLASALLPALARPGSGVNYPLVTPGRRLVFPRDHGAHPEFRSEWWYVTGALQLAADGRQGAEEIGFQLTFFRVRPGIAEELSSPLAAQQIVFAHAAVSRPGHGLRHAERVARAGLGGGFSNTDCDLFVGPWSMARRASREGEGFALSVVDPGFAFALSLQATQPPLLQGQDGYSPKGPLPGQASYYLSWPQLAVTGQLVLDGRRRAASGRAWFDHEWASEPLAPGSVGWDWIGINLDDGGALMAFRIRDADGRTLFAHATRRDAAGRRETFGPAAVSFTPRRHWTSPRNGAAYPVGLEISCGDQRLFTTPLFDDQEITAHRPQAVSYWEGLVRVDGTLSGRAYLELTGYAAPIAL